MVPRPPLAAAIIVLALLSGVSRATAQDPVSAQLRAMIAQARHPWARRPDFPGYVDVLARLYGSRAGGPVWRRGRPR